MYVCTDIKLTFVLSFDFIINKLWYWTFVTVGCIALHLHFDDFDHTLQI